MKILDLFAGLGGERRRPIIEKLGHEYITVDIDPKFGCTITSDIRELNIDSFENIDMIWASPPCTCFSVASIGTHWSGSNYSPIIIPKTEKAVEALHIIEATLSIIKELKPIYWFIENPRGILRKMPVMQDLPRQTVTYCQYGENRMKPTDIWTNCDKWIPRPACKNGDSCHPATPRGSHEMGTQSIKKSAESSIVPIKLWLEILADIKNN